MCNAELEFMVHILYNVLLYILTEPTGLDFVRIIQREPLLLLVEESCHSRTFMASIYTSCKD